MTIGDAKAPFENSVALLVELGTDREVLSGTTGSLRNMYNDKSAQNLDNLDMSALFLSSSLFITRDWAWCRGCGFEF